MHSVLLIPVVPSPTVVITHNRRSSFNYAGSMLTLNCTITLPLTILSNVVVPVNSVIWTGPHGQLMPDSRITVSSVQQLSSGIYISAVVFNSLRTSDDGTYSCKANVSHSSPFINDGVGSNTSTLIIQGIVERVQDFPISLPHTLKHLQLHYKQSSLYPSVCPYCVFQYLRKLQLQESPGVPIKPWNP